MANINPAEAISRVFFFWCVMYGTRPNKLDWGMFKEKAERNNV